MNSAITKKALLLLFAFFVGLFVSPSFMPVQAQSYKGFDIKSDADLIKSYTQAVTSDGCATPSLECLVHQVFRFTAVEFVTSTVFTDQPIQIDPSGNVIEGNLNNGGRRVGVLPGIGSLIGQFYAYPAAGTGTYVADLLESAHIVPKAYAQGLGFAALNPILDLWKAFRNIAYMFFVLIFIIIGFMIMFRQKIGGQAAITAQQAIPSIVISLILVTFSYAIAGFMIDLMYLSMFLILGVFGQTLPDNTQNIMDMNIRQIMGSLFSGAGDLNAADNVDLISNLFSSLLGDGTLGTATGAVGGVIGGVVLTVVLAIAILIGSVKLFFELLKSYASVILSIVTSPLILMFGAIPGKNPVVPWIKDLIGNLLPFPTVLFVLVVFYQFTSLTSGDGNQGGFIPPFLLARGQAGAIASLMGLALILALPEIVKEAKKGLVKEGFGSIVFKAATESAKQGFKGGEVIPGTGIKVPGANVLGAPLFGTKSSRQAIKDGKDSYLGRGLAGGVWGQYVQPRIEQKAATVIERVRQARENRKNNQTPTTPASSATNTKPPRSYEPPA